MVYALLVACIVFMAMQTFSLRYLKAENIRQNLLANGLFSALIAIAFVAFVAVKGMAVSATTILFGSLFGFGFIATVSVYYYAMQSGPLSYTTFFFSASMIVPVIIGLFAWNESLKLTQGVGIAMFMAAFYCISVLGGEKGGKVNMRWIILCFATWLLNGLIGVVAKQQQITMQGTEYVQMMMMSFVSATVFALVAAVIFFVMDAKKEKKAVGALVKADMSLMWEGKIPLLGAALGSGMANVIITYLASRLPSGYLYPITLGSVVVLVSLFSILVLKEKPSKPGLIGILIGLVAIVVTNL
jgi:drug/metabolite transporter (DMT)-like permease